MASWLMRLKYVAQKCSLYSFVIVRTHMKQHPGELPPIGKLVRTLNKIVQHEKSYMTYLQPSLLRDESMKPTIRGMKDEWVLYRFLLLPTWDTVSVGDIVGFHVHPTRVSAAFASASPASASPASASPASASPASASPASASPASASPASASPASASPASASPASASPASASPASASPASSSPASASPASASPASISPAASASASEAASPASASPAAAGAKPAMSDSNATAKAKAPSFESTQKANTGPDSKRSDSKATAEAKAERTSFPVIFRRVAAIPGDEMVSSQPSDEPFRIEKDQFWVLADDPAVPAKEALDSRTLGPVHVRDMVGRALYVVRSPLDHEPIHNSDAAMVDDSAVMAMECQIEDLLKRINEESW